MSLGKRKRGILFAPENDILKQSEERESAGACPAEKTLRREGARLPIFAHDLNLLQEPVSSRKGLRQRTNRVLSPPGRPRAARGLFSFSGGERLRRKPLSGDTFFSIR
jgi:hypothetical protein